MLMETDTSTEAAISYAIFNYMRPANMSRKDQTKMFNNIYL